MRKIDKISTLLLVIMAILYAAFGLISLANPLMMSYEFGYTLTLPSGFNEFRAAYGGQFIMLGVFLFLGGNLTPLRRPALLLLALDLGGIALGRLISLLVDGVPPFLHMAALTGEVLFSVLAFQLFVKSGKTSNRGTA